MRTIRRWCMYLVLMNKLTLTRPCGVVVVDARVGKHFVKSVLVTFIITLFATAQLISHYFSFLFLSHLLLSLSLYFHRGLTEQNKQHEQTRRPPTFLPAAPATLVPAALAASCMACPCRLRRSLMSLRLNDRPVPS